VRQLKSFLAGPLKPADERRVVGIRLDPADLARVEAYRVALKAREPHLDISISEALRAVVRAGLDALEARRIAA